MSDTPIEKILMTAIEARREELGWTWSEIAKRAGMHRQQVDNIRKNGGLATTNTIRRLLEALGLNIVVVGVPGFDPNRGRDGEKN